MDAAYDNASKTFSITGTGQTFVAAKLERGAKSTIAYQDVDGNPVLNDAIPDKALELIKCQRYQVVIDKEIIVAGRTATSDTTLFALIPLPVTMRSNPAISRISGNYIATAYHSTALKSVVDFNSAVVRQNGIYVTGTISTGLGASQPAVVVLSGSGFLIDANL